LQEEFMTIGIIGAGAIGSNVARLLAKSRIEATIANSRGPASLGPLVAELGPFIRAGTTEEAASADIVFVAVRWVDVDKALAGLPAWNGRIVIDATNAVEFLEPGSPETKDPSNPLAAYGIRAIDLGNTYSSAIVRELVPGARLVKGFNNLEAALLATPPPNGQRAIFYSGDDDGAKAEVHKLIEQTGYFPVDLGSLNVGDSLTAPPFGSLSGVDLVKI
jgi:8-hydroxy-5-deazaflavin:NADPH oxidoreductase